MGKFLKRVSNRISLLTIFAVMAFAAMAMAAPPQWQEAYIDQEDGEYWYYDVSFTKGWHNGDGSMGAQTKVKLVLPKSPDFKEIVVTMEIREEKNGNIYVKHLYAVSTYKDGTVDEESLAEGFEYYSPDQIEGYVSKQVIEAAKAKLPRK